MLAITVSVKLWSDELHGQRILIRTDNQNTELTINTGRFRIPFIQSRCVSFGFSLLSSISSYAPYTYQVKS